MSNSPGTDRQKRVMKELYVELFEELEETDGMLDKEYDCPICFTLLERTGRCETCPRCGWGTCSL